MNKDKTIYLHVGYPKTGSTSIQQVLYDNRKDILRQGYLYPETCLYGVAHHLLMAALERDGGRDDASHWVQTDENLQDLLVDLQKEIEETEAKNIVISSEDLSLFENITNVREYFRPYEVRIIIYLRRQDEFLDSRLRHIIQNPDFQHTSLDIPDYLLKQLDYKTVLNRWAEAFGAKNIDLIPFEKTKMRDNHIQLFLKHIGLNTTYTIKERVLNDTLTQLPVRFKLYANKMGLSRNDNWLIRVGLKGIPDASETPYLLDSKLRFSIAKKYEKENSEIAKKYLGNDFDGLFTSEYPIPDDSHTDQELNIEELAQVSAWLYVVSAKQINSCLQKSKQSENELKGYRLKLEQLNHVVTKQRDELSRLQQQYESRESQLEKALSKELSVQRDELSRLQQHYESRESQLMKTLSKELSALKQFHIRQVLLTYTRSRKSFFKSMLRFLRHPMINEIKMVEKSVDSNFYWRKYPEVISSGITAAEHYIKCGAQEGKNPSAEFNTTSYLIMNPKVAQDGINPLVHFILNKK